MRLIEMGGDDTKEADNFRKGGIIRSAKSKGHAKRAKRLREKKEANSAKENALFERYVKEKAVIEGAIVKHFLSEVPLAELVEESADKGRRHTKFQCRWDMHLLRDVEQYNIALRDARFPTLKRDWEEIGQIDIQKGIQQMLLLEGAEEVSFTRFFEGCCICGGMLVYHKKGGKLGHCNNPDATIHRVEQKEYRGAGYRRVGTPISKWTQGRDGKSIHNLDLLMASKDTTKFKVRF